MYEQLIYETNITYMQPFLILNEEINSYLNSSDPYSSSPRFNRSDSGVVHAL